MKDYEALSRKHFDQQAAEYDARDTVYLHGYRAEAGINTECIQ